MRCPCCECYVHDTAFHKADKYVAFMVGETVLSWEAASKALAKVDNPAKGRILLDEALDFRGNFFLGAVGDSCVGCAVWQRCFNLIPRWAMNLECLAIMAVFVPWAFATSLRGLSSTWGGVIQIVAEVYGLFCGVSALFLQVHAICQSLAFTMAHAHTINFAHPPPSNKAVRAFVRFFAAGCHYAPRSTTADPQS
ncbi:hypothetical protein WJX72_002928 [[Myrmecia] bisecta]|uniref:Uncharacterized protein n=1 Tax=[Myrmecia] bisecta TaxID=41462 RepID=A0AAW1NZX9_9CHLO